MAWDLSCRDWQDRIRLGRSLVPDLPLDKVAAKRSVAIFNKLKLPDVPGLPALEQVAGEWFRDIVRALHGSIDLQTGERMVREPFVLVPKKSGKTSLGSALMLTSLLLNKRPSAEFLLVAPTQPISELAFKQVEGMIAADEVLSSLMHVQVHIKKVTHRKTRASLQVKSFDPSVLTGVKPAGVLLDELHVVSGNANADRVVGQLRGGLISQPEGFLTFITTQSERPPAGVFKAELDKARAIRDGKRAGAMLPVLYEFPDGVDWRDTSNWWMVTPNRGRSITIERLVEDYQSAVDTGIEELARWSSQHLNIEIGLALRSDRWVGADFWEAATDVGLTLDDLIARSDVAVVGIDGGGLDDLFGLCVLGRDRDTRRWLSWCHAWAHRSVLERRKSEAQRLHDLAAAGDLTIVEHLGEDIGEIVSLVLQIERAGILGQVGLDPVGVGAVVDALAEVGIEGDDRVVGVSQGYRMMGAIKTAERKLADGTLAHGGQALMAWCVGNARVEQKGNAIVITKQASGTAKIDPLMAFFDAVSLMAQNPEAQGSVYTGDRGLLVFG